MINPDDLALALEWAEHHSHTELVLDAAAVRVIQALPDSIVDGAEVRRLVEEMRYAAKYHIPVGESPAWIRGYDAASKGWADDLEALLPAPPKPAMIKRGAIAVHPEHGEVLVISNHPEDSGRVWVALDSEDSIDGSWILRVKADELTDVDELSDSGTPETNNDSADDEEVDDYRVEPSLGVTHNDWWGASRPMTQADVVRADGAPVEPTREFPEGAHYDAEGNATEPENVPAGEAWLIEFEGQRHYAVRCWVGINIVYMFWTGNGRWTQINANYEDVTPVAPLVPKPEPRVLTTLEDYQNAAIGTVVRIEHPAAHFSLWGKRRGNLWQSTAGYKQDNNEMSDVARMVIWAPKEADDE